MKGDDMVSEEGGTIGRHFIKNGQAPRGEAKLLREN
jgi:hypothetical protein